MPIQFSPEGKILFTAEGKIAFACGGCQYCASTPSKFSVTIAGLTNIDWACLNCVDLNGTFICDKISACEWVYYLPGPLSYLCGYIDSLVVQMWRTYPWDTYVNLRVAWVKYTVKDYPVLHWWNAMSLIPLPVCAEWWNLTVGGWSGGVCNNTGTPTCTITAL